MEVDALVRAQVELHTRMARAPENLKKLGAAKITQGAIESRIQLIDSYWQKFMINDELLRSKHWTTLEAHEYATKDFTGTAEETYLQSRGTLVDWQKQTRRPPSLDETASAVAEHSVSRAVLPRINLPVFSGLFEDWPPFRDLFTSMIGRDQSLSAVEQLHYLKTSVRGEAEQLIRCYATTEENFQRAWKTLAEHYENRRLLVNSYCNAFLALPRMKSESPADLRRIYHGMTAAVGSLEGIGRPIFSSPDLFVHMVVNLLDSRTRREWELTIGSTSAPPSYEVLRRFLEIRLQMLVALSPGKAELSSTRQPECAVRSVRAHHTQKNAKTGRCPLCSGGHFILFCEAYRKRQPLERRRTVEGAGLCGNCLERHALVDCKSTKTCASCNLQHHSTLHEAYVERPTGPSPVAVSSHVVHQAQVALGGVLLATARVFVKDSNGALYPARALVDPASETSLIAESLVQRIRVARTRVSAVISGVGATHADPVRGSVRIEVLSSRRDSPIKVEALILPRITNYGPRLKVSLDAWPHLRGLALADPELGAGAPVELLLGAEVFPGILLSGLRRGGPRAPVAQETSLGWIITGIAGSPGSGMTRSVHVCSIDSELLKQVRAFWEQEEVPPAPRPLTREEQECEDFFVRTVSRQRDGRYSVRLPTTNEVPDFSASYRAALGSLKGVERRFESDRRLRCMYTDFMREYAALGHMKPVQPPEGPSSDACYLPHHGVLKTTDDSIKLRVVFNGLCRLPSGDTLNRHLLTGLNLVPLLADVLLRWRRHRFAFVTDIEKMYRQIQVHQEDQRLQRVLWRLGDQEEVGEFALTTVTYGLSCVPFLAIRTLHQLAKDEERRFPKGAAVLRRDSYVDDILAGADTETEAVELRDQLIQLCDAGGFPLRKWAANVHDLLEGIPLEHRAGGSPINWEDQDRHSALGLQWHASTDAFQFRIRSRAEELVTRRTVLSRTAGLYDPLGWLAPVVVRAKIYVQQTWLLQLEWDDPFGGTMAEEWKAFERALPVLENVRVPRWLGAAETSEGCAELHGFADASERAYAAVVYLRTKEGLGRTTLVQARTRVAPLKQISLPRLELCAAVLLARLAAHVQQTLIMTNRPVTLWSDSTVALGWIKGHPAKWTTFVANRVAEIQRLLPDARWRHVPGENNPADCASRGIAPGDLLNHPLWWSGPSCLEDEVAPGREEWRSTLEDGELPEQRRAVHTAIARRDNEVLTRFSSWHRLLRVTAWMLRWRRATGDRVRGPLTPEELNRATARWITMEQAEAYPRELVALRSGNPVPSKSPLLSLSPILDKGDMLRVGGRLQRAAVGDNMRHPVILPPDSRITGLIIEALHRRALHGGAQLTLALIRQQYWIPRGRLRVRQVVHRCTTCARWRAAAPQPMMGELPSSRVTPSRPFTCAGVDYAGPVLSRSSGVGVRLFGRSISGGVSPICVSARALQGAKVRLRHQLRGRGYPAQGAFPGGRTKRHLHRQLSREGVRWRFNSPAAPHFGGMWEAAVKSTKHHLRRVVGDATLTFEEMVTLLTQVEACLNSRPLQALTDDPGDLEALTPGHFLIGAPLISVPEPTLDQVSPSRLTRWKLIQQMRDHFWRRWSSEYISTLQPRPKWRTKGQEIKVGQLCLVRTQLTPPSRWPLARVEATHPGPDGHVRVVTVRTATGELTRPVVKVVPLPEVTGDDELGRLQIATGEK